MVETTKLGKIVLGIDSMDREWKYETISTKCIIRKVLWKNKFFKISKHLTWDYPKQ